MTNAAKILGEALRRVGYHEDGISELLGDDAYSSVAEDVPALERRLAHTKLATVVRLLFLQLPAARDDVERALGARAVEALGETGLADVRGEVVPKARIVPVDELLVAADGYSRAQDDPPEYVANYSPTSRFLHALTPRRRIGDALDVGTGSGVHALLAAEHARRVVATDVNPRALHFTELNAALNGLTNVETRRGSLFEPVDGERFDLITCNAPYVVSPERRWVYRDAGFDADALSERIVREAARHLADDGFASLNVSWIAADAAAPDERVVAWAEGTGCDSWILVAEEADPLGHAAAWNSHLAHDVAAFNAALDEWTRYLDEIGAAWVADGTVVLHRHGNGSATSRVDSVDEDVLEDAGDQIERAFASRSRLAELPKRNALLGEQLRLASPVRLEHELEPRRTGIADASANVSLAAGTSSTVETTAEALELLASLDGSETLAEVVDDVAHRFSLDGRERASLEREAIDLAEELLELGALEFS
jgi:methylase of polypeptide subunit release factors